eukprot:TRINITY_DN1094_c0_g1_i1.p1 TRINITY_DN1094_c0_g1~~TRINITY_DN1094_c0_g1_i1.p1  ORF type:complete len:477 (+),score=91.63 TRINITY_DN1094_c0_g1_i1:80-1510(+)
MGGYVRLALLFVFLVTPTQGQYMTALKMALPVLKTVGKSLISNAGSEAQGAEAAVATEAEEAVAQGAAAAEGQVAKDAAKVALKHLTKAAAAAGKVAKGEAAAGEAAAAENVAAEETAKESKDVFNMYVGKYIGKSNQALLKKVDKEMTKFVDKQNKKNATKELKKLTKELNKEAKNATKDVAMDLMERAKGLLGLTNTQPEDMIEETWHLDPKDEKKLEEVQSYTLAGRTRSSSGEVAVIGAAFCSIMEEVQKTEPRLVDTLRTMDACDDNFASKGCEDALTLALNFAFQDGYRANKRALGPIEKYRDTLSETLVSFAVAGLQKIIQPDAIRGWESDGFEGQLHDVLTAWSHACVRKLFGRTCEDMTTEARKQTLLRGSSKLPETIKQMPMPSKSPQSTELSGPTKLMPMPSKSPQSTELSGPTKLMPMPSKSPQPTELSEPSKMPMMSKPPPPRRLAEPTKPVASEKPEPSNFV